MQKAIDIVLLPSSEINDLSIELSSFIKNSKFNLNNSEYLPHISLLMGGIKTERADELWKRVLKIVSDLEPFNLLINLIRVKNDFSGLHIEKTDQLTKLHSDLITNLSDILVYDNDDKSIAGSENVEIEGLSWINNFVEMAGNEKYDPHITLGNGKLDDLSKINLPIEFTASKIALCHLGNYCTCYEVLKMTELK